MKKKNIAISFLLLLVAAGIWYYVSLPAFNIHSSGVWYFVLVLVLTLTRTGTHSDLFNK